jgi:hypothetical protein
VSSTAGVFWQMRAVQVASNSPADVIPVLPTDISTSVRGLAVAQARMECCKAAYHDSGAVEHTNNGGGLYLVLRRGLPQWWPLRWMSRCWGLQQRCRWVHSAQTFNQRAQAGFIKPANVINQPTPSTHLWRGTPVEPSCHLRRSRDQLGFPRSQTICRNSSRCEQSCVLTHAVPL